jgi:C4-dicarboxylate-specific signal transduction histidine kinase
MTHDDRLEAEELAEAGWLADLGEIVGPVTHAFNNFLNTLLLQVAVLDTSVPEGLKGELAAIRRQGREIASMVRQVQQYRRRRRAGPKRSDLNGAAEAAAEELERQSAEADRGPRLQRADQPGPGVVALRLRLAPGLPPAPAAASDLRRLCRFLAGGAAATVAGGGALTLVTQPAGDGVGLRLEVSGAAPGAVARLLEPAAAGEGPHGLELAACLSLVRRLGGSMRVEVGPDGGEAVAVELPAARG